MSTNDQWLDAVEKSIAGMKRNIIDKFDETNSALTIIKGVVGAQGQDIKKIFVQLKEVMNPGLKARACRMPQCFL